MSALAAALPARADTSGRLQIATMDTVLKLAGKPEALPMAKRLGLAAVQVTLGVSADGSTLPLEDKGLQQQYLSLSRQQNVPINSTYINMLHVSCLKSNPDALKWVLKGIEVTKNLNAPILMAVFFGKCAVLSRGELNYVIDTFRDVIAPAQKAGVILGFENTLSGEDNRYAVDRIASPFFKVWYDVGNSTYNGYDVPKEIRMLGRERICEFHFKDKSYLGEGAVKYPPDLKGHQRYRVPRLCQPGNDLAVGEHRSGHEAQSRISPKSDVRRLRWNSFRENRFRENRTVGGPLLCMILAANQRHRLHV